MNPNEDMIIRILTVNMDKRIARYGEGVNFSIFKIGERMEIKIPITVYFKSDGRPATTKGRCR